MVTKENVMKALDEMVSDIDAYLSRLNPSELQEFTGFWITAGEESGSVSIYFKENISRIQSNNRTSFEVGEQKTVRREYNNPLW